MALFCPMFPSRQGVGRRRAKAGRGGRKDSAQPLPKEQTALLATRDFRGAVEDEVSLTEGEPLTLVYREEDWVFVAKACGAQGFVPAIYTRPRAVDEGRQGLGRAHSQPSQLDDSAAANVSSFLATLDSEGSSSGAEPPLQEEFSVRDLGLFAARFSYQARRPDDLSVTAGQRLRLLNDDDPDWAYVQLAHPLPQGCEAATQGFVPFAYVRPLREPRTSLASGGRPPAALPWELCATRDVEAGAESELSVRRGDWLLCPSRPDQTEPWTWALSARTRRSGLVPTDALSEPQPTLL